MSLLNLASRIASSVGLGSLATWAKKELRQRRYELPAGPGQVLPASNFVPVVREGGSELDQPQGAVHQHWAGVPGGHKWMHYFEVYDSLLAPLQGRPIRMLEIGVYRGASLEMWRRFLHPGSLIVGIDIDPGCKRFDRPEENVHVRIGSQADGDFLDAVVREFGPFDVVLDDGSHMCSHMIASFGHLYLPALVDDGLYIAEDTQTNFWREYRDRSYSFIDLCKDLVDVMHTHYPLAEGEQAWRIGHAAKVAALEVPRLGAQIRDITFHDSIVVIRKRPVGRLPATVHA
jgi:hypothetical protein